MKSELTTVATFSTIFEADFAKARLESEGIQTFITNENIIGMLWVYSNAVGGVRVKVENHNVAAAKEILALVKENEFELESSESDWGVCPKCGSNRIEFVQDQRATAFTWLLLGLPLLFPREKYVCHNCFNEWQNE